MRIWRSSASAGQCGGGNMAGLMNYIFLWPLALQVSPPLAVAALHPLFGRKALLLSSALPLEHDDALSVADAALASGASVTLLVPMPESGAEDADFDLLQQMQRFGFPRLMERLGFAFGGVAGQYGLGNRQRIDFKHVRADDVEQLSLALADADVLLLHTPQKRLAEPLQRARWRLQRRAFSFVVNRLRADDVSLARDDARPRLHWAWLAAAPAADSDAVDDGVPGMNE